MTNQNTYRLDVHASTVNLVKIRNFVAKHAAGYGFDEDQIYDIRLAVGEACTNIIKHAYKYDEKEKFEIKILFKDEKLCITLKDKGRAFDPKSYDRPDLHRQLKERKRGGVGVYLIRKLMDKVEYLEQEGCNVIQMYKFKN